MAKHNRWTKVKHRKAAVEKRRGKVWTKIAKAIIVAAKNGGADPTTNLTLRYAMDEARYANMPRDTVERAIQKGAGGGDMSNYENVRYECYGPGGVAIIIDALTDNRTRTATDVRLAFSTYGGNLGASGCVAYMFQQRGQIFVDGKPPAEDRRSKEQPKPLSEERVMEVAMEAGALDVEAPDDPDEPLWTIVTDVASFNSVKAAVEAAGLPITDAQLSMIPENSVAVAGENAKSLIALIDAIEESDDVQKVYTNADIADEE